MKDEARGLVRGLQCCILSLTLKCKCALCYCCSVYKGFTLFFNKNQIILAEPQCSCCFSNFRLICSYFVLVTIIFFDLALHIFILIIRAEYFWPVMAGLKKKVYTSIIKLVYITFYLLREPMTMLQLKILMASTLLYCKVSSKLVHSVNSLLIFVSSFN